MNEEQFKQRTKQLAVRVIRLVNTLPANRSCDVIAKQLVRSATSIGANYRAACRAKSAADMINKLKIVEEEADETLFWQELLVEADLVPTERMHDMMNETQQIIAMTVASLKTLRARQAQEEKKNQAPPESHNRQ
ncbi:MAG: four helix bundle protein [Roseiflexaceae bacterium]